MLSNARTLQRIKNNSIYIKNRSFLIKYGQGQACKEITKFSNWLSSNLELNTESNMSSEENMEPTSTGSVDESPTEPEVSIKWQNI